MKLQSRIPCFLSAALLMLVSNFCCIAATPPDDPLLEMGSISSDPLEAVVIESETVDGIVTERVEFTSRVVNGKPERVQGIFAYPAGAKKLPAVFWSMGGMAAAGKSFPELFAKKGYACLAITLPHPIRDSRARFNVDDPKNGNFTLLLRDQMRGITLLTQRAEVDPELIAVGGASYGGVFSTLLAGIDPRLKAGLSYFGGGNHALGTNLPQFNKMKSLAEVEIWNKTIDPAFRHKTRSIPFLWAVAFNDNWFYFPAVTQTFKDALSPDKRMVIMPRWRHGFPENIDNELSDFLDTTLTKTRPAYNAPGPLELIRENGRPVFRFEWTGKNPVKSAELIVSYGEYTPWYGWLHRACFNFPAQMNGASASAPLPIPSLNLPLVAWGNITDTQDVVTSTLPVVLTAKDLAGFTADPSLKLNCFIDEDFGPAAIAFYERTGEPLAGVPDLEDKHSGAQSMRVSALKDGEPLPVFKIGLFHNVTGLAHKLSVCLKADKAAKMSVSLTPIRPPNWGSAVVAELVAKDPRLSPLLPLWKEKPTPISVSSEVGTEWKEVTLEVPTPTAPVEGYKLEIRAEDNSIKTYWVDSLRMLPVWP